MAKLKAGNYKTTIDSRVKDVVNFTIKGTSYTAKIEKESFLQKIGLSKIRAGAEVEIEIGGQSLIRSGKDLKTSTPIMDVSEATAKAGKAVAKAPAAKAPASGRNSSNRTPCGYDIKSWN